MEPNEFENFKHSIISYKGFGPTTFQKYEAWKYQKILTSVPLETCNLSHVKLIFANKWQLLENF